MSWQVWKGLQVCIPGRENVIPKWKKGVQDCLRQHKHKGSNGKGSNALCLPLCPGRLDPSSGNTLPSQLCLLLRRHMLHYPVRCHFQNTRSKTTLLGISRWQQEIIKPGVGVFLSTRPCANTYVSCPWGQSYISTVFRREESDVRSKTFSFPLYSTQFLRTFFFN